jgi:hypothetical protein
LNAKKFDCVVPGITVLVAVPLDSVCPVIAGAPAKLYAADTSIIDNSAISNTDI